MERICYIFLASKETCCNKDQIYRNHFLCSFYRNHHHSSCFFIFLGFQAYDLCFADITFFIRNKFCNGSLVYSWIMTENSNGFFLAIVCFQDSWPLWPRIVCGTFYRRFWHHLQLCNRFCSQTDAGTYTVISGITTANDQNILILCQFIWHFFKIRIQQSLCNLRKEIYCKINTFCFSSGNLDISRIRSTTGKDHSVIFLKKFFCCNVLSHICVQYKLHTFFFHQPDPSVYHPFFQFHVGDTITEKSTCPVTSFINSYVMASPVQLLRCCQSGRTTSDYCYRFACTDCRFLWLYPTFFVCSLYDGFFIFFGGYRFSVQVTGTCCFAESRTHSGSKFRKTVCLGKSQICLFPVSCIYKVISLRNKVMKGTAGSHSPKHHS